MKKLISLLVAILIAISGSVCAFAAQSPGGETKPDQFNVVGTVTQGDEKLTEVTIEIGDKKVTVDDKGNYRIEGLEAGTYTATFKKGDNVLGTVTFEISKGTATKYEKLPDGSYKITVAENVFTIDIDFNVKDDGAVEIIGVTNAGNDSPVGPPMGDMMTNIAMLVLVLSLGGIAVSVFFKKKYSC